MARRVVVTGAGGRLGGTIARRLRAEGRLLAGLDVRSDDDLVTHVVDLATSATPKVSETDATLRKIFAEADALVHCAAVPGPSAEATPTGHQREENAAAAFIGLETLSPLEVLQQNVLSATRVFAELSRTAKTPKRVVYSSSAFAMGYSHDALAWRPSKYPVTEADDPTPLETYGLSKDFGERAARLYCLANENVEVVALRFTNIIKRDKSADLPWPYDDRIPLAQWAWCHEDDVVDAHLKSLDAPTEALFGGDETPRFRALLVAAPSTRFAEPTADLLRRRFSGGEMMTWPETYETQPASIFDATQASTVLDWHPRDWRDVAPKEEEPQPSVEEKPSVRGSAAARACLEASSTRFFGLGGFQLDSGAALPDGARLAYTVVGSGPNIAVMPTSFGATHADVEYLARAVFGGSSENYSVYVFDMLGNGVSHSPSTTSDYPPVVTVADNVRAQRQALAEALGRDVSVSYAAGYSMGAMQAFEWARQDGVRSVIAICGASGCVDYNAVFLRALEKVLEPFVFEGRGTREDALAAFGAVYAGWGTGYPWYRDESWRDHGFDSLDDFLDRSYGGGFADDDPADLLAMVRTWRSTRPFDAETLRRIASRVLLMPCDSDTYFRLDDISARELAHLPEATLATIRSPWGHRAGDPWRPGMDTELAFIQDTARAFLDYREVA